MLAATPGRRLPEWLAQLPLLGAMSIGVHDIGILAVVFGMSLQLPPVAITLSCRFMLPREKK